MKGTHHVIVENKRLHYEFDLRRNITVLKGESASGKTTLIDMIQEYMNLGQDSMVNVYADKRCGVISGNTWRGQLSEFSDSLIFIDEGNSFVLSDEFASTIKNTDNYYLIVTREGMVNLPYSVDEIYGIHHSGKYGDLRRCYQEFYHIYGNADKEGKVFPEVIITEDSNSGFQFFDAIGKEKGIEIIAGSGKSNILDIITRLKSDKEVLIVADGAAFGSEIERVIKYTEAVGHIKLYLPESFEWILLHSGILKNNEIKNILENPGDYINSEEYFSWERFFTRLLIDITKDTYLRYNKQKLNKAYLQGTIRDEIIKSMENIFF